MALSMFLRSSACTNGALTQQMRLFSQRSLGLKAVSNTLPSKVISLQQVKSTPILSSVRSFGTTAVRMSEKPHDHAKLWVVEKAVNVLLIPMVPIGLLIPNKITDTILAILVSAHVFWGLDAIRVEYIRVLLFGPTIPKVATWVAYFLSVFIMGGLFYVTFNDIGLCRGFWRIWRNVRKSKKGLEAIAVDYVRAAIFGPLIPKLAIGFVYLLTIATLGGLFYIITHDIGLGNTIRKFWAIKAEQQNS